MTLADRCRNIRCLILDVDGVLSEGGLYFMGESVEAKRFHVRDGSALKIWQQAGMRLAWLSGRAAAATKSRAADLGVEKLLQGSTDKAAGFKELLQDWKLLPEGAAYLGDDLQDVPVLRQCGLALAVADACCEVRRLAQYITRRSGGHGAVREVVELILRCQGRWPDAA